MSSRDRLLKLNKRTGLDINQKIEAQHPDGDQFAIFRKEIRHIEQALNITPTAEFASFDAEAERVKAEVKERMEEAQS